MTFLNELCSLFYNIRMTYHAEHDDDHLEEFERALQSGILEIENMGEKIIKSAKVTARLYRLQMEEMGNY